MIIALYYQRISASFVLVYASLNFITLILYGIDKYKAQHGKWRIKESTLHFYALLGGWSGAAFAQTFLRHKTQKLAFRRIFWLTVVVNVSIVIWALNRLSFS